ncbi:MAG: rRNA pseudouridine synthase [Puniceicoccales bacterium]|jgi:23S rRNA pseudouridine2605 synthase|nr:rRNA pseudouridine synthase [Puniceicoccales bacterium]
MVLRIQKFLSQCGYCSRRKAETLILESRVTVNAQTAAIGQIIDAARDIVKVDTVRIHYTPPKQPIVLMLNKPRGVICTHPTKCAPEKTVFDFIPDAFAKERFLYCGRLDKDSQGMLILTNDGDFAHKLTHPSSNITKIYHVTLSHPIASEQKIQLLRGIEDQREVLRAEKVLELPSRNSRQTLEIHLKQGRKREIRRMIDACDCHVHRLKRVQIGQLKLKNLSVGHVKCLAQEDISRLFAL